MAASFLRPTTARSEVAVHVVDLFVRALIHHHLMQQRPGQPAHHRIVPDRSPRFVVPAGDAEYRYRDSIEPPLDAQPAPVVVVFLVIEPVVPVLRTPTPRLLRLLDDRQVMNASTSLTLLMWDIVSFTAVRQSHGTMVGEKIMSM